MTTSHPTVPTLTAGGAAIPQIGLGTWQVHGEVLHNAVAAAAKAGYRHFDTATRYENEADLGSALRATPLQRDDYFLTSKVWFTEACSDDLIRSAEKSVETLGVGPLNLLLLHWPANDVPLSETIAALCKAKQEGLTKHIGVSNFSARRLGEALALTAEPIVANQCECHPYLPQFDLRRYCAAQGVAFVAYSPIGSGQQSADPTLSAIAQAHGKSAAQVILRWHLQSGNIAIPRSSNPERVAQNIAVTDFALSTDDMARIDSLGRADGRMISPSWVQNWD